MIPAPGARILIVDDDELTANRVASLLVEFGHVPRVATEWSEALDMFDDDTDLVLLDMVMPKVGGLKLAPLIRERSRSYVPVVFLTASDNDVARERALNAGADDFVTKPVRKLELKVRITAMLRIRALTKSLHRPASRAPCRPPRPARVRRRARPTLRRKPALSTSLLAHHARHRSLQGDQRYVRSHHRR